MRGASRILSTITVIAAAQLAAQMAGAKCLFNCVQEGITGQDYMKIMGDNVKREATQ